MALTFPDSPTTGDLYTAENGVVYEWNGVTWDVEAAGTQYWTGDNDAISYVGDISTGGSASFAGAVTLGGGLSGSDGSYLYPGSLSVRGDSLGDSNSAFAVFRGGNSATNQTASIAQDGSANFAGPVTASAFQNVDGYVGTAATKNEFSLGALTILKSSSDRGANDSSFQVLYGVTPTVNFTCDGRATFAGEIVSNELKIRQPFDSGVNLVSASYGRSDTTGNNQWGFLQIAGKGNPGATLNTNGVFQVVDQDTNTYTAKIFKDGSASFLGATKTSWVTSDQAAKVVPAASSAILTINGDNPTFVKVYIMVNFRSNGGLQAHFDYDVITCDSTTTGGETPIRSFANESGGAFQVAPSDFSISRSGSNIIITYNNQAFGENVVNFFVTGKFNSLSMA